jgi:hypothetical protein
VVYGLLHISTFSDTPLKASRGAYKGFSKTAVNIYFVEWTCKARCITPENTM